MGKITVTTPRCINCGERSELIVDEEPYLRFLRGTFVQDAFPQWPSEQREMLITGTHPACWEEMFPPECEALIQELEAFYDDPMTAATGMGSEMSPLVIANHKKRHENCPGLNP